MLASVCPYECLDDSALWVANVLGRRGGEAWVVLMIFQCCACVCTVAALLLVRWLLLISEAQHGVPCEVTWLKFPGCSSLTGTCQWFGRSGAWGMVILGYCLAVPSSSCASQLCGDDVRRVGEG